MIRLCKQKDNVYDKYNINNLRNLISLSTIQHWFLFNQHHSAGARLAT